MQRVDNNTINKALQVLRDNLAPVRDRGITITRVTTRRKTRWKIWYRLYVFFEKVIDFLTAGRL